MAWLPKKIRATINEPLDSHLMDAVCMGAFAIYCRKDLFYAVPPTDERVSGYNLDHITSGLSILLGASEEDCMRMGEYLWSRYCLLFRNEDPEDIREKISPQLKEWCQLCRTEKKWIDPNF